MKIVRSQLLILLGQKGQREGHPISLRQVVKATHVSEHTVRGFANNTLREYPTDAISALCRYLDCEVGDLLKLEETQAFPTANDGSR